jgi:hypothetical protein
MGAPVAVNGGVDAFNLVPPVLGEMPSTAVDTNRIHSVLKKGVDVG